MEKGEVNEAFVKKLGGSLKSISEFELLSNSVCLIKSSSWTATGFYVHLKCGDTTLMGLMTNNHVVASLTAINSGVTAVFKYNVHNQGIQVQLHPELFFYTNPNLDFTFMGVDHHLLESHGIQPVLCLLKPQKIEELCKDGMPMVTIIQHPGGWPKCFSQQTIHEVNRPFFTYMADTLVGSSGSPIFIPDGFNFQLIGIHKSGFEDKYNKGILVEEIMQCLATGQYTWPPKEMDLTSLEGNYGDTLLKEVKSGQPNLEIVKDLLERGAKPDIQDKKSRHKERPLHYAVKWKNKDLLKLLLEYKADPNLPDNFQLYPLHLAVEKDCEEVAQLLIKHGADVEAYTQNKGQDTPMHFAARANKPQMIKLLAKHGADVNAKDESHADGSCGVQESKTPLIVAAEHNYFDAVKALVDCSADVKVTGNTNETPRMIASSKEHKEIAHYLKSVEEGKQGRVLRKSATDSEIDLGTIADSLSGIRGQQGNQNIYRSQSVIVHVNQLYKTEVQNPKGPVIIGDSTKISYEMKGEATMPTDDMPLAIEGSIPLKEEDVTAFQLQSSGQSNSSCIQPQPDLKEILDEKNMIRKDIKEFLLRNPWVKAFGIGSPNSNISFIHLFIVLSEDATHEKAKGELENFKNGISSFVVFQTLSKNIMLKYIGNIVTSEEDSQSENNLESAAGGNSSQRHETNGASNQSMESNTENEERPEICQTQPNLLSSPFHQHSALNQPYVGSSPANLPVSPQIENRDLPQQPWHFPAPTQYCDPNSRNSERSLPWNIPAENARVTEHSPISVEDNTKLPGTAEEPNTDRHCRQISTPISHPGRKISIHKIDGTKGNEGTVSFYYCGADERHYAVTCYHSLYCGNEDHTGWKDEEEFLECRKRLMEDAHIQSTGPVCEARIERGIVNQSCDVGLIYVPADDLTDRHILDGYAISAPPANDTEVYILSSGTERPLGRLIYRDFHWKSSWSNETLFEGVCIIKATRALEPGSSGSLVFYRQRGEAMTFGIVLLTVKGYFQGYRYNNELADEENDDSPLIVCQQLDTVIEAINAYFGQQVKPCFDECARDRN